MAGSHVTLSWQPAPPPVAAVSFVVEVGTTNGGNEFGRFPVGNATQVSGVLAPGVYYTRVRGVGPTGEGTPSSEVIVTVPSTSTAPEAPRGLTSSAIGNVVSLNWTAAAGNAQSYVIDVGTASGLSNIGSLATGNLDTTFATPAPNGAYYVRVRAANVFGSSPPSNEVVVVVP